MSSNDKPKKRRRWLTLIGAVGVLFAGLALMFDFFPEEQKELRRGLRKTVERTFPQQAADAASRKMLGDLEAFLKSMTNGLGDGLVTLESTRLDGVAHRTVRGTHPAT